LYAKVVVDTGATSSIDFLTYEIPDSLAGKLSVGACVLVPLGARQAVGYVVGFDKTTDLTSTKPLIAQIETPFTINEDLVKLARWIAERYACSYARSLLAVMPGALQSRVEGYVSAVRDPEHGACLSPAESSALDLICGRTPAPSLTDIRDAMGEDQANRAIRSLEKKGIVSRNWKLIPPEGKARILKGVRVAGESCLRAGSPPRKSGLTEKQAAALDTLLELGRSASLIELSQRYGITASVVKRLVANGHLTEEDIVFRRMPAFVRQAASRHSLSPDQESAVSRICASIDAGGFRAHLLRGVTASGKTEVYLRCIEHVLALGKTVLVLLPEIALTTQVMNIFKSRFGGQVAVMHSALSSGERADEWMRIAEGEARIAMGARSAVFAPLSDIGLVIVDEEHEPGYKQDTAPRYHGREVAEWRARNAGAVVVLGSATPSVESYYRAETGEINLISMPTRVPGLSMPTVHVADLRQGYVAGAPRVFSDTLEELMRGRLVRGEQVILLQNRRAFSTFLLCRECGNVPNCPNCAVTLKYYSAAKQLRCHHCEHVETAPTLCPQCGGRKIGRFGIGTERVEEEVRKLFPEVRTVRMDSDTTARKGAHGLLLNAFREGEAQILIGTQMVAKGLDFPNVTLVGVISADTSLHLPDFRAAERTFQLVSQVAGRSGRGAQMGEVVVQTFDPDHYAIKYAVAHDYEGFFREEIEHRKELGYPPFGALVSLFSQDQDNAAAEFRLTDFVRRLRSIGRARPRKIEVLGPNPAVISRVRGEYRWHLLLRSRSMDAVLGALREVMKDSPDLRKTVTIDVDPMSMV